MQNIVLIWRKKADELEREVDKLKTTEFMLNKKNDIFQAVVANITSAGMFLRLENGIEGLLPLRLMDDYFIFNPKLMDLYGRRSKKNL